MPIVTYPPRYLKERSNKLCVIVHVIVYELSIQKVKSEINLSLWGIPENSISPSVFRKSHSSRHATTAARTEDAVSRGDKRAHPLPSRNFCETLISPSTPLDRKPVSR